MIRLERVFPCFTYWTEKQLELVSLGAEMLAKRESVWSLVLLCLCSQSLVYVPRVRRQQHLRPKSFTNARPPQVMRCELLFPGERTNPRSVSAQNWIGMRKLWDSVFHRGSSAFYSGPCVQMPCEQLHQKDCTSLSNHFWSCSLGAGQDPRHF